MEDAPPPTETARALPDCHHVARVTEKNLAELLITRLEAEQATPIHRLLQGTPSRGPQWRWVSLRPVN